MLQHSPLSVYDIYNGEQRYNHNNNNNSPRGCMTRVKMLGKVEMINLLLRIVLSNMDMSPSVSLDMRQVIRLDAISMTRYDVDMTILCTSYLFNTSHE